MRAILTKILWSTDTLPTRIKAEAGGPLKPIILPYNDDFTAEENHKKVAQKFADQYKWKGTLISGALPNNKGGVHVFLPHSLELELEIRRSHGIQRQM